MGSEDGDPEREQIREELGMLTVEMRQIVEGGEGEGDDEPGHEGPLGPLPLDLLDGLE